ncbi:hypothetical protein DY000_02047272 [Brassica cretica]|uniref:Serpin domain-containing protein n=1 Tax=Brassica cretica TaxID=69181 RepID=A0ABQ7F8V8_BRACR|nr:hypothetical protein DY000_02047272 [Brassica cretica]
MFQQLHESEDYYDHFSYSVGESEPVYDIFHEGQAELLHKVHAEFQKMNVSITEDFRSLKATMNHMMEIVKKIKLSGRRSDGGNAPLCAQENLAHKTAPPKRLRAQSSPMGHKPRTSRFKQPVEHKRFNSSKFTPNSAHFGGIWPRRFSSLQRDPLLPEVFLTHELNAVFSKLVSVVFADHSANGGPKITSVNGVWIEQTLPIDSSFKDLFENVFKAAFDGVDFLTNAEKVHIELNKWAEDHTNGLIKDLLPPGSVSSQTGCVFGNALYFKGAWEVPFDKSYTKDKEFQLLSGTSVSVPFMSSYKNQYIKAYDGFKVLRIPYRQGNDVDTNRSFPYR